jgi:hypothetical protein
MQSQAPITPDRFRFAEQSDDDFDELTYRLIMLEHPRAVKMAAPDGGLDTLLPLPGRDGYSRGWQAKRYTGNISWSKCKESLDRAVEQYGIEQLTFCFARNLTVNHEKLFVKHLVGRHAGVTVDYLNASALTARLTQTDEGQRVARHFFGDRDALARIERAQRAGGALASESDARERSLAVGEFMASSDPYFSYPTAQGEVGLPMPAAPAQTVMSVEHTRGAITVRTDAIPRDAEAMKRYGPRGQLIFSANDAGRRALRALQRALTQGGEVEIDSSGVSARWDQLPPMFAEMVGETVEGKVKIVVGAPMSLWPARITADTDRGAAAIDLDLAAQDSEEDWEFLLSGSNAGLTFTIRGRWDPVAERGEVNMTWTHTRDDSPAREQAPVLAFLKALHGSGTLRIEDRSGRRPSVEQKLRSSQESQGLSDLLWLFEAVALIEERAQATVRIPESISGQDAQALALVAQCVRDGGQEVTFRSMEFVSAPDGPLLSEKEITDVSVHQQLDARVLGQVVPLGKTITELPPLRIVHREPASEGPPGHLRLRLAPASGEPAEIWIALQDGEAHSGGGG